MCCRLSCERCVAFFGYRGRILVSMAPAQSKNVVSPAYPKANALKCCKRRSWLLRICDEFTDGAERCRLSIAFLALLTSSATNLAFPTIMGRTIDVAIKADSKSVVRSFFITVAGIFGIGALASWIRVYAFNLSAHRIEQRMRKALFRVLLSQVNATWRESIGISHDVHGDYLTVCYDIR